MTPAATLDQFSGILLRARKAGMLPGLIHPCLVLHAADDGSVITRELATAVGISQAAASGTVDRLVTLGWVTRANPHPEDRRLLFLVVTDAGRKVFTEVFGEILESP